MTELLHPSAFPINPIVNALERDCDPVVLEMADGPAWTGGRILAGISQLTRALQSAGIAPGARVALLAGNSVEVLLQHAVGKPDKKALRARFVPPAAA